MPLLHTVYTRIGRAFQTPQPPLGGVLGRFLFPFLVLLLPMTTLVMTSCSNDDEVHFVEISEYYAESCHLDQATQDSIVRFSQKVDAFVAANPQAKEDPLYPRILHNIQVSGFNLNTDWDGENNVTF